MNDVQDIVSRIHDSPHRAVLAVAGAGSHALAWLLGRPGASRTVLEALVPYGPESMIDFLGFEPAQAVSQETARNMAKAAFKRALLLGISDSPLVGLACTAALVTDRTRRGRNRCHVAVWDDSGWTAYDLVLDKGRRDREAEEDVASRLVLQALAAACGLQEVPDPGLTGGDSLETVRHPHPHPLEQLLSGEAGFVTVNADGDMTADWPSPAALLPGSFNPLHQGHEALAHAAADILRADVAYELSVVNVDKPALTAGEVRRRLAQFQGKGTVALTRADTYHKKAALFPGCAFVIGWDTAARLVEPRYYGGDHAAMTAALLDIRAAGCRFLVAGRQVDGSFRTLADLAIPQGFEGLLQAIPESAFRLDISSTDLRESGG